MGLFRKIRDRLKKGVRDIASGAKDNPALAIAAMFGLPALMGGSGGAGGGGSGFGNFMKKMLGNLATKGTGSGADEIFGTKGSGILGLGQNLLKGLTGGKGMEGNAGILSLIASMIAKKAFEAEKEGPLSKEDRLSEIDLRYNDITGGPQRASERFRGLHYDPITDTSYDVKEYDVAGNKYNYKDFEVDAEGNIIDPNRRPSLGVNEGGIVGLQAGGNPFMNRGTMRGSIGGGMNPEGWSPDPTVKSVTGYRGGGIPYIDPNRGTLGGGMPGHRDPTVQSITGYNPLRQSNPRFITRANGGSTAGDLADVLEDNPGISQFFPRKFGMIHGPGGPKEDKIPAMLSDGEFVMTAKAVDNAGGPKSMYNLMNRLDPDSSRGRGIV
jgi:hypothetical protein